MKAKSLTDVYEEIKIFAPETHKAFMSLIDEYQQNKEWALLFKDGVKFHDLPDDFQISALMMFLIEDQNRKDEIRMERIKALFKGCMLKELSFKIDKLEELHKSKQAAKAPAEPPKQ